MCPLCETTRPSPLPCPIGSRIAVCLLVWLTRCRCLISLSWQEQKKSAQNIPSGSVRRNVLPPRKNKVAQHSFDCDKYSTPGPLVQTRACSQSIVISKVDCRRRQRVLERKSTVGHPCYECLKSAFRCSYYEVDGKRINLGRTHTLRVHRRSNHRSPVSRQKHY